MRDDSIHYLYCARVSSKNIIFTTYYLFSGKTTSHKDYLEVCLPDGRLLPGMLSSIKITLHQKQLIRFECFSSHNLIPTIISIMLHCYYVKMIFHNWPQYHKWSRPEQWDLSNPSNIFASCPSIADPSLS